MYIVNDQLDGSITIYQDIQVEFLEKSLWNYQKCLVYGQEAILFLRQAMYAAKQLKSMQKVRRRDTRKREYHIRK